MHNQLLRYTFLIGLIFQLILVTIQVTKGQTTTRYVSTTGTNTNPVSATSWATSTTNLQGAINSVSALGGGQVWVATGVYKPTTTTGPASRTISFSMANSVTIVGGFAGNESLLSQRSAINPVSGNPSSSTLSGEIGNLNSTSDNSYHVIFNETGLTNSAVLDGFVITGGNADLLDIRDGGGGGVFNNGGFNLDGTLCSPTFRNCLFQGNSAQAGGAMLNYGQVGISSPVLISCAFVNNYASRNGGAITNDGSDQGLSNPVLTNCLFLNNRADLLGGAIFNTAEFEGTSSPVLTNCAFQSNSSGDSGGAMFNEGSGGTSSPTLTNCSFQSNTSQNGGALYNSGFAGTSNPVVTNSVFWDNGDGNTFVNDNATLTATYSLFQPSVTDYGTSPTNLTNVTASPFVAPTSVSLLAGSAAINAGNPASTTVASAPYSALALPATDLVGNLRIVRGRVDMGAVEFAGPFSLTLLTRTTPITVCAGNTVTLSVTALGGVVPYSYTWAAPAGITLSAQSTSAVSASVGADVSGVQTLTITVADALQPIPVVSTSLVSLTVNAAPSISINASSTLLTCTLQSVTLTASGSPATYLWTANPALAGGNSTDNPLVVSVPGQYTVTATTSNGCTATAGVTIGQSLTLPAFNVSSSTICQGGTASLTATGCAGIVAWPGGVVGSVFTNSLAAVYTATCTVGICTTTASGTVTIAPQPQPTLVASGPLTCTATTTRLTATGGASYTLLGGPASQTSNTGVFTVGTVDTYTVLVATVSGCVASTTATVISDTAQPAATLSALPSATLTCEQTSLTLTAGGGVSYAFSGSSGGIMSQNAQSGTAVINLPGTYSVVVTGSNSCTAPSTIVISQSLIQGTRLYVSASQTAVNGGDGLSWQTAFKDLQSALNYPCIQSITEIWVAAGVYKPTSTTSNRSASFAMRNNLAIRGGFVGNETDLSERPVIQSVSTSGVPGSPGSGTPSSSTLSGDIDNNGTLTGNSFHVLFNPQGLDNTAVLDGFVVTGGNANGTTTDAIGGAIYNNNSSPTLLNCSFQNNGANAGGAIYNINNSSPVLANCSFLNNQVFFNNNVIGRGGAVYNQNSSPTLTNCSFLSNQATGQFGIGGAFINLGSSRSRLTNCSFLSNQAIGQSGSGGAIYNESSSLTLTNCSFQNNQVASQGGAIYNNGSLTLTNSVFWNNGGNNTFANVSSSSLTATYSLFDNINGVNVSGPGNLTNVMASPFVSATSVALNACSPAINTGNSASYAAATSLTTDLAGNPRFYNSGTVDMGAYEFQGDGQPISFSVLGSGTATCSTSPTLNLSGSETGVSYQLQRNGVDTGTATIGTGLTISFGSQPLSGTYTVLATRTSNTCTVLMGSSATVVSSTAVPTVSISATSGTLTCANTSVTLTATTAETALMWSNGATTSIGTPTGITVNTIGTYSVMVTGSNGCTAVSNSLTISENTTAPASPTLSVSHGGTLTCAQTALTLTASATGSGLSYAFAGPSGVLAGSGSTRTVSTSGVYSVTLTGVNGCTTVASTTIHAAVPRTATVTADGSIGCGRTLALISVQAVGATSFTLLGPGSYSLVNTTGQFSVTASGSYTGLAGQSGGCVSAGEVVVSSGGVPPSASNFRASGVLGPGSCAVRLLATGTGNSFVMTGPGVDSPGNYVFSNVYRNAGTYEVFGNDVRQPGMYTLTVYSGNCVATYTTVVTGTACSSRQ